VDWLPKSWWDFFSKGPKNKKKIAEKKKVTKKRSANKKYKLPNQRIIEDFGTSLGNGDQKKKLMIAFGAP
jgi:hypothetical protein